MSVIKYRFSKTGLLQSGEFARDVLLTAQNHQVSVAPVGTTTAGTASLYVKHPSAPDFTPVKDSAGDDLVIDLSLGQQTFTFAGAFSKVKLVVDADFDGTSVTSNYLGW